MTQTYFTVLTAIGAAKLANLAATSRALKLTEFAVGTGGSDSYAPTAEQLRQTTQLVDETFRGPISVLEQDTTLPSQYYMEGYVPIDVGPFIVREAGWFDADGDMIFATRYPPVEKTIPAQGAQVDLPLGTYVSIHQVDGGLIQILVDPSKVLASRTYVDQRFAWIPFTGQGAAMNRSYRFMGAGELTLPDSGDVIVIVDHTVNIKNTDCIVKAKAGKTIITPHGADQQTRIRITGKQFVYSNINGQWRVS